MIERLIDNWLTNTNERALMLPFCQLLISKGYKIFYISPHQQQEAGKDIIAQNSKGGIECFQLKNGDISLPTFLGLQGELGELLNHPIQHASIPNKTKYKSYFVTNGRIKDPARTRITELNAVNWNQKRATKLDYYDREQLLADFIKYYGTFLPSEPSDFKLFVEFYIANGTELFPTDRFSHLLESFLKVRESSQKPTDLANLLSSSIVITNYCLNPWIKSNNHIAQVQAWVTLQAYIMASVEKYDLNKKHWESSFKIITVEIKRLLLKLFEELKIRKHLIEGDWTTDGIVYPARVTVSLGYLCALPLYLRLLGEPLSTDQENEIVSICKNHEMKMRFWGEVFTPCFLTFLWFNEKHDRKKEAYGRLAVVLQGLSNPKKAPEVYGFPSPFHSYEETIRLVNGFIKHPQKEHFTGQSYSLESIIELFARRNERLVINTFWKQISHTQLLTSYPAEPWEYFTWRTRSGKLIQKFPNKTQKWQELIDLSNSEDYVTMPIQLRDKPAFALLFLLVFPHRLTPDSVKLIDKSLN